MTCSLFAHSLLGPLASPRPKAEEEKRKRRGEAIAVGQGSALEAVQKNAKLFLDGPEKANTGCCCCLPFKEEWRKNNAGSGGDAGWQWATGEHSHANGKCSANGRTFRSIHTGKADARAMVTPAMICTELNNDDAAARADRSV